MGLRLANITAAQTLRVAGVPARPAKAATPPAITQAIGESIRGNH